MNPLTPIDLLSLYSESKVNYEAELRVKEMKKLYEQVSNQIEKANAACKVRENKHRKKMEFSLGDLVWLDLSKERFVSRRKNKLMESRKGSLEII